MDKQLFLKEKDYELIKFKSLLQSNQSANDPLINPQKKIKKNKANALNNEKKKNTPTLNKLNPLFKKDLNYKINESSRNMNEAEN